MKFNYLILFIFLLPTESFSMQRPQGNPRLITTWVGPIEAYKAQKAQIEGLLSEGKLEEARALLASFNQLIETIIRGLFEGSNPMLNNVIKNFGFDIEKETEIGRHFNEMLAEEEPVRETKEGKEGKERKERREEVQVPAGAAGAAEIGGKRGQEAITALSPAEIKALQEQLKFLEGKRTEEAFVSFELRRARERAETELKQAQAQAAAAEQAATVATARAAQFETELKRLQQAQASGAGAGAGASASPVAGERKGELEGLQRRFADVSGQLDEQQRENFALRQRIQDLEGVLKRNKINLGTEPQAPQTPKEKIEKNIADLNLLIAKLEGNSRTVRGHAYNPFNDIIARFKAAVASLSAIKDETKLNNLLKILNEIRDRFDGLIRSIQNLEEDEDLPKQTVQLTLVFLNKKLDEFDKALKAG